MPTLQMPVVYACVVDVHVEDMHVVYVCFRAVDVHVVDALRCSSLCGRCGRC